MASTVHAYNTDGYPLPLRRLWRISRRIEVRILEEGNEVDSFQASGPDTLRAALKPIYRHLPPRGATVCFTAIREEALPLGLHRERREAELTNLNEALAFLAA